MQSKHTTVHHRDVVLAVLILIGTPFAVWAQSSAKAQIAYADDDSALQVIGASGQARETFIGDTLAAGETIKTGKTTVEISLVPNGSIIKVGLNTTFKIEALAGSDGRASNDFALIGGKIRTVAAKTSAGNAYKIRTPSAVAGVRGTDFALAVVEEAQDAVYVRTGSVDFSRVLQSGELESIIVGAGQFADTFAASFAPLAYTMDQLASEFQELQFEALDPEMVPQTEPQPKVSQAAPEANQQGSVAQASPAPAPAAVQETPAAAAAAPPPATGASSVPAEASAPEKKETAETPKAESKLMKWLGNVLGFEIGSIVIDGTTYSKAIIQPTFSIGKLQMGFYLPIVYTSDIFDTKTWYRPAGNNEWSFGSELWASNPSQAALDALRDLGLKIRSLEYGNRLSDPFYLKVGNLSNMEIGHGVLMRNFANDSSFPVIRRIGFNSGFDIGAWGAEAIVDDLLEPEVIGGRLKFLKFFGATAIVDTDPAGDLESQSDRDALGNPMLVGSGFDISAALFTSPLFSLRAYADIAAVAPYLRTSAPGIPEKGYQLAAIYDSSKPLGISSFRNYGLASGFLGRIAIFDWRLEYRHFRGIFRPTFFDATYERNRIAYAQQYIALLKNPNGPDIPTIDGIYGEGGFSLLRNLLSFSVGYFMPWSLSAGADWETSAQKDYLQAKLYIRRGLIPFYNIWGSLSYERTGFAYALRKGQSLMDANTIFKGELVFAIAETVDFAITSSLAEAPNGLRTPGSPLPKMEPTITFETRIHF